MSTNAVLFYIVSHNQLQVNRHMMQNKKIRGDSLKKTLTVLVVLTMLSSILFAQSVLEQATVVDWQRPPETGTRYI